MEFGALRTAPQAESQHSRCKNQIHSDYDKSVLTQQVQEQPMTMIMAMDEFDFGYKLNNEEDMKDIRSSTMSLTTLILCQIVLKYMI